MNTLQDLAQIVTLPVGESFFRSVTLAVGNILNADYVILAELDPNSIRQMRTLVVYGKKTFLPGFSFSLEVTPYARLNNEVCLNGSVQENYPDDEFIQAHQIASYIAVALTSGQGKPLGMLAALYRQPIQNVPHVQATLKIVARRIAEELQHQTETKERQNLEEQLRQNQKMGALGLLTEGMVHDFTNILQIIQNKLDALKGHISADGQPALKEILASCNWGHSLCQQLLSFGAAPAKKSLVDAGQIVQEVTQILGKTLPETCDIKINLDTRTPQILANRLQLEQMLVALCIGDQQSLADGGRVSFELTASPPPEEAFQQPAPPVHRYACISVRINRFRQAVARSIPIGRTTLPSIVRQHNGFVENSTSGRDEVWKLYFPEADAQPMDLKASSVVPKTITILLAEDDDIVRSTICQVLERAGYRVVIARDGEEAIEIAKLEKQIHLAILDIVMPRMNGDRVFQILQAERPEIKVIFQSGYFRPGEGEEGLQGRPILSKPFVGQDLLRLVHAVLTDEKQ